MPITKINEDSVMQLVVTMGGSTIIGDKKPPTIDHTKHENPYESRYGSKWLFYMKKALHPQICITDMVMHIYLESKKLFPHSSDWFFYHDALLLMTLSDCITWMEQKGIL